MTSQGNDVLIHTIEDVNTYYANRLRQAMMAEVPTLAIDTVHIFSNTSILMDEALVHRLGLIVLKSDDPNLDESKEFTLNVKCTENNPTKNYINITAGMLVSSDPRIYPVHPETVILKLKYGEEINLKAFVKKGTGKEHAKWCPVSSISYNTQYLDDDKVIITMAIEAVGSLSAKEILTQGLLLMNVPRQTLNNYKNTLIEN